MKVHGAWLGDNTVFVRAGSLESAAPFCSERERCTLQSSMKSGHLQLLCLSGKLLFSTCSQQLLLLCLQTMLQYGMRGQHQLCTDSHVRLRHRFPSHMLGLFSTFRRISSLWRKLGQSPNRQLQQFTLLVMKRDLAQNTTESQQEELRHASRHQQCRSRVLQRRRLSGASVILVAAWTAHLTRTKASQRRVELRQVDLWRRLPPLAAADSSTIVYQLVGILVGTNQRTVMLVNEALSKRGVLISKCPIEYGYCHELG